MILCGSFAEGPRVGAGARPAWTVFLESQRREELPDGIVFQAEHARLAGALAAGLREEVFGPLPAEVIEATALHDAGWQASDEAQAAALPGTRPRPFPALSTEETLPSWRASIALAAARGGLVEALVSRHFTMLGRGDPAREDFVRTETERRYLVERGLRYGAADLDRWTDVVGFCDIVSLYLCSGVREAAEFPLAHPASAAAGGARKVVLGWNGGWPEFSGAVMREGTRVEAAGFGYPEMRPRRFGWEFRAS